MNHDQKHFLARVVEISAFGQFGAVGYTAFKESNWIAFSITGACLVLLLVIAYAILSISVIEGGSK